MKMSKFQILATWFDNLRMPKSEIIEEFNVKVHDTGLV